MSDVDELGDVMAAAARAMHEIKPPAAPVSVVWPTFAALAGVEMLKQHPTADLKQIAATAAVLADALAREYATRFLPASGRPS